MPLLTTYQPAEPGPRGWGDEAGEMYWLGVPGQRMTIQVQCGVRVIPREPYALPL